MNDLWKKYREFILYLFFGGLTTLVSILSYAFCERVLGLDPLVANIISWILAVAFAYGTNRTWVFSRKADTRQGIFREIMAFFGGRIATLLVEEGIILVFITWLGLPAVPVKAAAQVIVIALNYVISKFFVFKAQPPR